MITVYNFEQHDLNINTNIVSKSKATLEAIERNPRAKILLETAEQVDASKIDGNGHYRP
jgi:hypothetical protein